MNVPLLADAGWPALYLLMGLLTPIPVVAGLLVEWTVLHFGFSLSWKKAAWVDLVMNAVSAVGGTIVIAVGGLFLNALLWSIERHMTIGYWNFLIDVFFASLLAVAVSTAIEAGVVRGIFKIPLSRRRIWLLCGANALSTGIACLAVIFSIRLPRSFL